MYETETYIKERPKIINRKTTHTHQAGGMWKSVKAQIC